MRRLSPDGFNDAFNDASATIRGFNDASLTANRDHDGQRLSPTKLTDSSTTRR